MMNTTNASQELTTTQILDVSHPPFTEELLDEAYQFLCKNETYVDIYKCLPAKYQDWIWVLVVELILHPIVGVTGIIGNILAIIVLTKDKSASSTNTILRSLAVCDTLSLVLIIFYNFTKNYLYFFTESSIYNNVTAKALANTIVYFTVPASSAAIYGSHVITVMVTIDRFIAVCKPLVVRRRRQVHITLVALSIYVLAYQIPLGFEYVVVPYAGIYRETFYLNKYTPVYDILREDNLYEDIAFQVGYNIVLSVFLRDIGPIVLLIAFNIKLYQALKAMKKRYLKMRRGSNKVETRRHTSPNENMTRTVVIVVSTYTILTLPSLVLKLMTTSYRIAILLSRERATTGPELYVIDTLRPVVYSRHYKSVSNLLISVASSANFIIYIIFARKFRRIFLAMFCNCKRMKERLGDILLSANSSDGNKVNSAMAQPASKVAPLAADKQGPTGNAVDAL